MIKRIQAIVLSAVLLILCLPLHVSAITVTISAQTFLEGTYNYGGTFATLRVYSSKPFIASDGTVVPFGEVGTTGFFKSVTCTVSSNTLNCPSFTLPSTDDALDDQTARYTFVLYDYRNVKRDILFANLYVPSNKGSSLTFAQIVLANNQTVPWTDTSTYTKQETDNQINLAVGTLNDASDSVKGRTKLSVPAASSSNPIAVGDNDTRLPISIFSYGALGTSTGPGTGHDDYQNIQNAITAACYGTLIVPRLPNGYKHRSTQMLNISCPIRIIGDLSQILFDFPAATSSANGRLFNISSSNVTIEGLHIDATGVTSTLTGGIRYAIFAAGSSGSSRIKNIKIRNNRFTNLTAYGNGALPATLYAMHAIYSQWVDGITIEDNEVDTISGNAVVSYSNRNARTLHNDINKTGWASISYYGDNNNGLIDGNTITGEGTNLRYWGGSIDILGQHSEGLGPDFNIRVVNNYMSGRHEYGGVIRMGSPQGVYVAGNKFESIDASLTGTAMIAVSARGGAGIDMSSPDRAPKDLIIIGNIMRAKGTDSVGVYIQNNRYPGATANQGRGENITVTDNIIRSIDSSNYFQGGVWIHGMDGGFRHVTVNNNHITARPINGAVSGAIALTATASSGVVDDVTIRDNKVTWLSAGGASSGGANVGVLLGNYVDNVDIEANTIDGFFNNIQFTPNTGTDIRHLYQNKLLNTTAADINLAGVVPSSVDRKGTVTIDPASINATTVSSQTFTLSGVVAGDSIVLNPPPTGLTAGLLVMQVYASGTNQITVVFQNTTGSPIDQASGSWTYTQTR